MSWIMRMTLPSGASELYEYDAASGFMISTSNAARYRIGLVYDAEGNIIRRECGRNNQAGKYSGRGKNTGRVETVSKFV